MYKFAKKFTAAILAGVMTANAAAASADAPASSETPPLPEIVLTPEDARYFAGESPKFRQKLREMFVSILETDGYEQGLRFFKYMELENEEEVEHLYFSEEELELLKSGEDALLSVTAPRATEKYSFLPETVPEDYDCFSFVIVLDDGEEITQDYHLNDSPYTLGKLMWDCKISDPQRIGFIYVQMGYFYFEPSRGGISAIPNKCGWNEIDGKRYYLRDSGTLAKSPTTIDGIRYAFDENGVCLGRYTGYSNSGKGRRYWKNGELLKNKWIKVKGERRYYADENGYFVTGKREIRGKNYLFDQNGAFLGEAPAVIEYRAPDPDRLDEIDCVRVDFKEAVSSGCSLALATCIGLTEQTKDKRVYAFLADEVICGAEVPGIFTVTVIEGDYAVEDEPGYTSAQLHFKENVRYLLPLWKAYSLLPEDRFFSNGNALIELRDDLSIASASVQGREIPKLTDMNAVREFISSEKLTCGQEIDHDFVRSDDLSEIVKGSDFILEVEIEGIVHDRAEDWTMYNCRLTDTVKAAKNDVRTVYAALPKGSVSLNGKYLLLLNRTKDKSFLYTLSSPNGSLYPADAPEAAEVRALIASEPKTRQTDS